MANAARAPFYAPRPGDDNYWFRGPIANGAVRLTTTQVKFYGQPGQAPTKRWSQFYTLDDPAVWSGSPLASDAIHPLLTAAGRVKPYRWLFGQDDASFWLGSPLASDIIHPLLTAVGQARSREWLFGLDDPSPWWGWTNRDLPILQVTATASPFVPYIWPSSNEEPGWTGHRNHVSSALTAGASQSLSSSQWRFIRTYGPDDVSPWQYTYQHSALTPNTFGLNLRWGFNFVDDPPSWAPTLENLNSAPVQILSSGGQPHTKQQTFTLDDPSVWYSYLRRNQPVLTPVVAGTPTTSRQPSFATDDASSWQWTPPNTVTIQLISYAFPGVFVPDPDDASFWSWAGSAHPLTLVASVTATPFSSRFIPTLDEPSVWAGGLRPVALTITTTPAPSPFAPTQWHFSSGFGNDDAGVWNASSHNAFFTQTQPLSFKSAMWNLNIPDDTPRQPQSSPSAVLYLPVSAGATLIQRTLTGVGL